MEFLKPQDIARFGTVCRSLAAPPGSARSEYLVNYRKLDNLAASLIESFSEFRNVEAALSRKIGHPPPLPHAAVAMGICLTTLCGATQTRAEAASSATLGGALFGVVAATFGAAIWAFPDNADLRDAGAAMFGAGTLLAACCILLCLGNRAHNRELVDDGAYVDALSAYAAHIAIEYQEEAQTLGPMLDAFHQISQPPSMVVVHPATLEPQRAVALDIRDDPDNTAVFHPASL
ncbi:MAG: hypothetical protein EOO28_21800 [Comamonadaceae bacterium]|nr:MAG: hypothetical protein EOO28_21800 [Comamonadaceae bacterium]